MGEEKALIIDDDTDLCFILREVLKSRNISVSVANSLFDAKNIIHNQQPAIIILDNNLPDGRGSEFIPYLNEKCPSAKIFLTTGDYDYIEEDLEGITHFIRKPFNLSVFRSIIDQYTKG